MKCAYCGKNNKPGATVCKRCGIALPMQPPMPNDIPESKSTEMVELGTVIDAEPEVGSIKGSSKGRRKLSKKSAAIGLLVLLGLILAGALAIVIAVNSGNIVLPSTGSYTVSGDLVVYKGEVVLPNSSKPVSAVSSLNGKMAALLTEEKELYSCAKGESTLVAKNVKSFNVSVDGSYIVYIDEGGLLWSHNCADTSAAPICICNDAVSSEFAVSPDGKSVLYIKANDSTLYAYVSGTVRELGKELFPVSISNGGKHIYCFSSADNSLNYVNKRGKLTFIRSNVLERIYLNSRHDEIVFSTNSGNGIVITMHCVKGGEAREILNASSPASPALPVSGLTITESVSNFTVLTCPFKSFYNKVFYGKSLVRYTKSECVVLDSSAAAYASASDNYSSVFYTVDGTLTKISVKGGDAVTLVNDCGDFSISSNGRIIWYLDLGGVLHYLNGSTDRSIAIGVERFCALPSGRDAIFISSGSLYKNVNGKPAQTYYYDGIDAEDILSDNDGMYYKAAPKGWQRLDGNGEKMDLSK